MSDKKKDFNPKERRRVNVPGYPGTTLLVLKEWTEDQIMNYIVDNFRAPGLV
jgi:hypothetical protein